MAFGSFTKDKSTFDVPLASRTLGFHIVSGVLKISASYTTNGEAVTAATFDSAGSSILSMICSPSTDGSVQASYDSANAKIQAYNTSDGAEVTATTNLTAAGKELDVLVIMT